MNIRLPDFSAMVALHKQDPEAFEAFRRHLLREAVAAAPQAHRATLEALLNRIEETRAEATTPMEAAAAASRLMRESMAKLLNSWGEVRHAVAGAQAVLILERFRR